MRTVIALLVRLFPRGFRAQFGEDMESHAAEEWRRSRAAGRVHAAASVLAIIAELLGAALSERLNPTWVPAPGSTRREWPMSGWLNDVRLALRGLRKAPGFTAICVGTLGLAIGATAGIFSVVETVLLDPLPFPDPDRLVYVAASAPGSDLPDEFGLAAEFLVQYRERSSQIVDMAAFNNFTSTLRADDRTERVWMSAPTLSLFETLGSAPLLGRLPTEEDENVVVLSHALWASWFGSDPGILGRSVYAANGLTTVIAVMGPEFRFPTDDVLLWLPQRLRPEGITPGRFGQAAVARLAPGATVDGLTAELTGLARELPERFGGSAQYARLIEQHRPVVRPLKEQLVGGVAAALWVLLGSVAIVLLIACANVANLIMVRAERRGRDLAIRRAIGAGRGLLFRSQMAESLVIAAAAGALAVALAWAGVPLFLRAAPPDIPRLGDVHLSAATVAFTLVISLVAALLCGLIPALRASSPNLMRLRDGSRGSTQRHHRARDGLVIAQTALALVLLIGSGLLLRSFQRLRSVDPGYDTANLFTFQIAPEGPSLTDGPTFARFHQDFKARIAALPGVDGVGIVENVPLNEGTAATRFSTPENVADPDAGALLTYTFASGDYFATMGIDVVAGRVFTPADQDGDLNVVISRTAANLLWPRGAAVGQRIRREGVDAWFNVIGVVDDVMQYSFRDEPQPIVYFPLVGPAPTSWVIASPAYVVKTARAEAIAPEIRALVREVAPDAPMYRVFTMAGLAADSMVQLSFTMLTLGITSLLALILGTVGLYGVLSYVVAERTREIGVRMALGAEAARVRRMVVAQGVRVILPGILIGVLVAAAATRALGALLYDVAAMDATTFLAMSAAMIVVGLMASYVPARRASSVDPIRSLRE